MSLGNRGLRKGISGKRGNLVKKSFDLFGHSTSVTLEPEFWEALRIISEREQKSTRQLVLDVDGRRLKTNSPHNLSGSLRVFILQYFTNQGVEGGVQRGLE
jgi:predicted DNA-binding ribbon-helix-helix protein